MASTASTPTSGSIPRATTNGSTPVAGGPRGSKDVDSATKRHGYRYAWPYCILEAAGSGDTAALKALLRDRRARATSSSGAGLEEFVEDVNTQDNLTQETALHKAFASLTALKLLLRAGCDPKLVDKDGSTVLHAIAAHNKPKAVPILLAAGAPIDAQRKNGDTALHVAAASGHGAIVQALVNAKADCSIINGEGNTCLHLAAGASVAAVKRLLVAGAPVNAQNKHQQAPLHVAAKGSSLAIAKVLVHAGADASLVDENGCTPAAVAQAQHNAPVYTFLQTIRDTSAVASGGVQPGDTRATPASHGHSILSTGQSAAGGMTLRMGAGEEGAAQANNVDDDLHHQGVPPEPSREALHTRKQPSALAQVETIEDPWQLPQQQLQHTMTTSSAQVPPLQPPAQTQQTPSSSAAAATHAANQAPPAQQQRLPQSTATQETAGTTGTSSASTATPSATSSSTTTTTSDSVASSTTADITVAQPRAKSSLRDGSADTGSRSWNMVKVGAVAALVTAVVVGGIVLARSGRGSVKR